MGRSGLDDFGAYRDALDLFDMVVEDIRRLRRTAHCYRLIDQQIASADSICSNMEEGYGRLSRPEFIRFLDIARGSARETLGRYKRMSHWLAPQVVAERVNLADKFVGPLTKTINTLRRRERNGESTREIPPVYETDGDGETKTEPSEGT
jgi:four helix bundle protein